MRSKFLGQFLVQPLVQYARGSVVTVVVTVVVFVLALAAFWLVVVLAETVVVFAGCFAFAGCCFVLVRLIRRGVRARVAALRRTIRESID